MASEETVFFKAGQVTLEGRYSKGSSGGGAVITHPHSQMGGTMDNNVVEAMASAFQGRNISTLRFNFRGVGRSEGAFDNGEGEQEDVRGALSFLADQAVSNILIAGYSFGAWVNAKLASHREGLPPGIMVSPPIDFLPFETGSLAATGGLVICGDRDQFCPLDRLKAAIDRSGADLKIVPGADHFYMGHEQTVTNLLTEYLDSLAATGKTT